MLSHKLSHNPCDACALARKDEGCPSRAAQRRFFGVFGFGSTFCRVVKGRDTSDTTKSGASQECANIVLISREGSRAAEQSRNDLKLVILILSHFPLFRLVAIKTWSSRLCSRKQASCWGDAQSQAC